MTFDETVPAFMTSLDVEVLDSGDEYRLLQPLQFYSAELRQTVVAPAGFVTDFASTPPGTRNVFPKAGPWSRAAVVHDAGYKLALVDVGGQPFFVTKLQADRLFLEGMVAIGVPAWKRTLMYWAVRRFGHGEFDKRRPEALAHA